MFARFWAWVELERERVGKKRKGGGAGCQVYGPLESADSWWGWRPVPWKNERERFQPEPGFFPLYEFGWHLAIHVASVSFSCH